MAGAGIDKKRAGISGDAEQPGMAERDKSGIADQHVEPERKHRVQQDLRRDICVIAVADPERHRREENEPGGERKTLHGAARPNRPCGRNTSTTSIGRKSTTKASPGNHPRPKM